MTDSPTPGRHRTTARRRRGVIAPAVGALSVLLALGPLAWAITAKDAGHSTAEPTKTLNAPQGNAGPAAMDYPREDDVATVSPTGPATRAARTPGSKVTTPPATPVESSATLGGRPSPGTTPVVGPTGRPSASVATRQSRSRTRPTTPTRSSTSPEPTPARTTTTSTPAPPPPPPVGGGGTSAEEQEALDLTNAARRQNGCGRLRLDDSLVEAAGGHASDMVRRHYFDHTTPEGRTAFDRMRDAGFHGSAMAENIAAGYDSAERAFAGWMQSEGHRANIMNCSFTKVGIGFDPGRISSQWGSGSWVQDFGRD